MKVPIKTKTKKITPQSTTVILLEITGKTENIKSSQRSYNKGVMEAVQDGQTIGWGDHFLSHKFITQSSER